MNHFNPILNKYNTVKKKLKAKVTDFFKKRRMDQQIHTPNLYIVIIPCEFFQQHFPDSSFQTDTLVSHTQSQPKLESYAHMALS